MGQNASAPAAPIKTETLYEILGVETTVTESELKKVYKKLALQLHPDRNYQNPEAATKQFARVQAAYDVLIDPQERAWYDNHGSEGPGGPSQPEYGGKITRAEELQIYLDPDFYAQYANDWAKFYHDVGRLFSQLAEEEHEAALDQGIEPPLLHSFGKEDSPWENSAKLFYDSWNSFSSIKSFSWEDLYKAWDAPDRRTRRAMEMKNKKIREAAKKEFNQLVRTLVNLIKKKDKRAQRHRAAAKKADDAENFSAAAAKAAKEKARKKKQEQSQKYAAQYEPQEWEKNEEGEEEPDIEQEGNDQSGDDNDVLHLFECIVCDKIFKSQTQLVKHEESKKHIKSLKQLQREMRKEGMDLGLDTKEEDVNSAEEEEEEEQGEDRAEEESHAESADRDSEDSKNKAESKAQAAHGEPSLEELLQQLQGLKADNAPKAQQSSKKAGKARAKREKKNKPTNEYAFACAVCQSIFPSRNKMFEHVKLSGHATPIHSNQYR